MKSSIVIGIFLFVFSGCNLSSENAQEFEMHEGNNDCNKKKPAISREEGGDDFFVVRDVFLHASMAHGTTGPDSEEKPIYWLVEDHLHDQTQIFEVIEPEGWNKSWIFSILQLTKEYSGWKVVVSAGNGNSITLTEGGFSANGALFSEAQGLDEIIQIARESEQEARDEKAKVLNFKLTYVRENLKAAMKKVDKNGYHYFATFASNSDPSTVYMLVEHKLYDSYLQGACGADFCAVGNDGEIYDWFDRKYYPYTDLVPPYWLAEFSFDAPAKEFTSTLVDVEDQPVVTLLLNNIVVSPSSEE